MLGVSRTHLQRYQLISMGHLLRIRFCALHRNQADDTTPTKPTNARNLQTHVKAVGAALRFSEDPGLFGSKTSRYGFLPFGVVFYVMSLTRCLFEGGKLPLSVNCHQAIQSTAHLVFFISLPTNELLGNQLADERCHGVEFVNSSLQKMCIALGLQYVWQLKDLWQNAAEWCYACEYAWLLFKRRGFMNEERKVKRAAQVSSCGGL
jgi:hypothetical protein